MKNRKNFTKAMLACMLGATILYGASSCSNSSNTDSKDVAEEHNEAKYDDTNKEDDAQFLVNAAEINMQEIKLSELAAKKAMMRETKELASKTEVAHAKALDELKNLAASKTISLPAATPEDVQEDFKKLNDASAHDFDKDYADMMVKGHKDAISKFEKASTDAKDADIRAYAASTLPILRTHLDQALNVQAECEKMMK
jgi:putative membrane protein